jgi:hypothetical protein
MPIHLSSFPILLAENNIKSTNIRIFDFVNSFKELKKKEPKTKKTSII